MPSIVLPYVARIVIELCIWISSKFFGTRAGELFDADALACSSEPNRLARPSKLLVAGVSEAR